MAHTYYNLLYHFPRFRFIGLLCIYRIKYF